MSIYIIIFIIILLFSVLEINSKTKEKYRNLYFICFIILTVFLSLRFGQGTDYFGYKYIYNKIPAKLDISLLYNKTTGIHSEIGWKILISIFKVLGFNFEFFVFVTSVFDMLCINRFISKYCEYRFLPLLLFYPTIFLTYFFSGLRQALAISLFLGYMFELYNNHKYIKYIICCLVCISFHRVSFIYLLAFLSNCKVLDNRKSCFILVFFSLLIGTIIHVGGVSFSFMNISFTPQSVSFLALAERILTFIFISISYYANSNCKKDDSLSIAYKLYTIGIIVYATFMSFNLISRGCVLFKCLEMLLLSNCFQKINHKTRNTIILYILFLQTLLTVKNIGSYIKQGNYYSNINLFNYPYITVINQEKIYNYRKINKTLVD